MNTTLLRLARRHKGVRYWKIPGAPNEAKLVPGKLSFWGVASFWWPYSDPDRAVPDWVMRGARLDWHRDLAKREIRKLIARTQP